MVPRSDLVVLLVSVVISIILGNYLYGVTHNVLVNVITVLLGTVVVYTLLHGIIEIVMKKSGQ